MNEKLVEKIVNATLYEGYLLYPYRSSSVKNRQRFNFGVLAPRDYAKAQGATEKWQMRTECLIEGNRQTAIRIKTNFLHLLRREIGELKEPIAKFNAEKLPEYKIVPSLEIDGQIFQTWEEATEREIIFENLKIGELLNAPQRREFSFPASEKIEPLLNQENRIVGVSVHRHQAITGEIELKIRKTGARNLYKITVLISNLTPCSDAEKKNRGKSLLKSFISTHAILNAQAGEFVSLLDTPEQYKNAAAACKNTGTFPVLVGENGDERDCILSSPIILYDYPQIAAESAGDLFDAAEIDEILTLRIMTLTDEEKREMRGLDDRARKILERTEMMPEEQLLKMHGALKGIGKAIKGGE
ncbi:MAG: hypothetical protein ACR2N3_16515 [Pyrinomonadaceae bacterium]